MSRLIVSLTLLAIALELAVWLRVKWGLARGDWQWSWLGWLIVHQRCLGVLVGMVLKPLRRGLTGTVTQPIGTLEARRVRRALSARRVVQSAGALLDEATTLSVDRSGVLLGTLGRQRAYATVRDVVLAIAPPQTGKTAWLCGRVIDAPGPVVVTSTKADVIDYTAPSRGVRALVLNPEGLGRVASTLRWNPVAGCESAVTAGQRAGYLLAGGPSAGGEDPAFWQGMSVRLLRCLLYAAAASDRTMQEIWTWVGDPNNQTPLRVLERQGDAPQGWAADLRQIMVEAPQRTRESVYLTLSLALQFMSDPAVAATVCPSPGERAFDVERFLRSRSTLYLLGTDRPHGSLAPVFTALTGHIFEVAKQLASQQPRGRLTPPLTLALDEAALICPVPLERWTADSGGRGISLLVAVQSPSQLYDRWGERGGQTIFNNANAMLIWGGLSLARDLDDLSRICGERDERVRSFNTGGERATAAVSIRRVAVMPPDRIRRLPARHALLLYRNLAPVIVQTEQVWERADVRRAQAAVLARSQHDASAASPTRAVPAPTVVSPPMATRVGE